MTAICASHYRNPLNDYLNRKGKKHQYPNKFRPRQSSRSAFYQPGLKVRESRDNSESPTNNNELNNTLRQTPPTTASESSSLEGHWNFRPSAIQHDDYGKGLMSVSEIVDCYIQDNERAEQEGVKIPTKPNLKESMKQQQTRSSKSSSEDPRASFGQVRDALFSASSSSFEASTATTTASNNNTTSSSCLLRCLQWNIQGFASPRDERNTHTITPGVIRSICETNADVLILNEIHWRDTIPNNSATSEDSGSPYFYSSEQTKHLIQNSQALLEEVLRLRGYHYSRVANHGDTPTLIATKHKVLQSKEIHLSNNRSALCLLLEIANNSINSNSRCWVVGTHLDAFDASQRRSEIATFLKEVETNHSHDVPIVIAGDFNQQRPQDYTPDEWKRIASSANLRGVPLEDGVAATLEEGGFRCILDDVSPTNSSSDTEEENKVRCNWKSTLPPPSTHWSGTTIDYTYYSNPKQQQQQQQLQQPSPATTTISPHGVYISPAGFSDHRMTVTDWKLTTTQPSLLPANEQQETNYIDKSFFFHHLPEGRHDSWLYRK